MSEQNEDQGKKENLTDLNEQMKGSDADYDQKLAEGALSNDKDHSEDKDYFAHLVDQADGDDRRDQNDAEETQAREDDKQNRS